MKRKLNFIENVLNIKNNLDKKEKNIKIGEILSSLQKPMKIVLDLIIFKQIKDVRELIISVKKEKSRTSNKKLFFIGCFY